MPSSPSGDAEIGSIPEVSVADVGPLEFQESGGKPQDFVKWFIAAGQSSWARASGVKGNLSQQNYRICAQSLGECYRMLLFAVEVSKRGIHLALPYNLQLLNMAYQNSLFMFRQASAWRGWYSPKAAVAAFNGWYSAGVKAREAELKRRVQAAQ